MRKLLLVAVVCLASVGVAFAGSAGDELSGFGALQARIFKAERGQALTAPSMAAPAEVVAEFLRSRGASPQTVESLRPVAEERVQRTGITNLRMEQEVGGLRVFGAYLKAAVNDKGELIHLIDNLAPVTAAGVAGARIDERKALRVALRKLYPDLDARLAPAGVGGNTTTFAAHPFFYAAPTVERVAVPTAKGALKTGFLVETWSSEGNRLHDTLVSGAGRIVDIELRTATDSYNIFPVDPGATSQTVVAGPGSGNTESPVGWLFAGDQNSISIAGNNAHAYLDADANNAPDPGGTTVSDGNFLTAADLTQTPSTADNRNVAVQNLFYLNNVIHDTLYSHGFTEAAGNFQEDNFGLGGRRARGSDSVNAEAQDGAGTDNANFATPRDGQNPRMQMFLWSGKGDHQVVIDAPGSIAGTYLAQGAAFGPALSTTGVTGDIVLVDDGTGTTSDACEALTSDFTGKIALIDRGSCTFVTKVKNAQNAGATGAIIANHLGDSIFTMGGSDATITISAVFIGKSDGQFIKTGLPGVHGTIRKTDPAPLQRDGDLDSDIVWHEYGHGLTWRMIGRMDGPLSGAIGEGMSDVLSIIINNDDVVAEYSFSDPIGIRTAPYTNYPRTYGDVTGSEVHFDGEVYAAIGWHLWEIFQANSISKETLLDDLVDGMNFTPAHPTFEQMRDGILQSVANSGSGHDCLIWQGFADYGVGVGAKAQVRGSTVIVTESFALPTECSGP